MPSVKIPKKSTTNDMTPFVDVAFLILTFFMLATKFKPEDAVEVTTPGSVSADVVPEKDVFTVTVDKDGRAFVSMDNPEFKQVLIDNLDKTRNLGLTPAEKKNYINMTSVGVPFSQLKGLLALDAEGQKKVKQPGIPASDSTGGELYYWVRDALVAYSGRKLNLLIKSDNNTKYPVFKNVLNAFKKNDQNKFLLITAPEDAPPGSPLSETRKNPPPAKKTE
ncbi:MAG: biopolymer transporter ExbD [Sphingobacteriales bacterium]|jgi:biopolymer transport protein ExbD|nr:MAG: biopolymer transporter ExbD [Sphingobacteriales bacterium]